MISGQPLKIDHNEEEEEAEGMVTSFNYLVHLNRLAHHYEIL